LVVATEAPFFADKQTGFFHEGEVLGKCRDIAASEGSEIIHALLSLHQCFHDKKTRGMGHCLDYLAALGGGGFKPGKAFSF